MAQLDEIFLKRLLAGNMGGRRPRLAIAPAALEQARRGNEAQRNDENAGTRLKPLYAGKTARVEGGDPYPIELYNAFQPESLMERNLRILEVCLSLRTQFLDYQKLARDAETASALQSAISKIEEEQEKYLKGKDPATANRGAGNAESDGSNSYVLSSQKETNTSESDGVTKATPASAKWAWDRDQKFIGFSHRRRAALAEHEQKLADRRIDPDDGSNFEIRRQRVEDRFVELMDDAACRSWAISDGLRTVYGKREFPLPPQPSNAFLDELVKWHKSVIDDMEITLRRDTEYQIALNLRLLKKDGTHAIPAVPTLPDAAASGWSANRAALTDGGTIKFRIPKELFPDQTFLRLRGFNISFDQPTTTDQGIWLAKVSPPPLALPNESAAVPISLPAVYIGNVKASSDREQTMTGTNYFNCDPCSGEWEIVAVRSSNGSAPTTIKDVWLNLALATLPPFR